LVNLSTVFTLGVKPRGTRPALPVDTATDRDDLVTDGGTSTDGSEQPNNLRVETRTSRGYIDIVRQDCPSCGDTVDSALNNRTFEWDVRTEKCPNCGQELAWSEGTDTDDDLVTDGGSDDTDRTVTVTFLTNHEVPVKELDLELNDEELSKQVRSAAKPKGNIQKVAESERSLANRLRREMGSYGRHDGSDSDRFGPGWYMIEGFYDDPARVIAGPKGRDDAKSHARFLTGADVKIIHTPALVNAIKHQGYNVEWLPNIIKPDALTDDSGGEQA